MKIIDDFLSKSDFETVEHHLTDSSFPWYYNDFIVQHKGGLDQFQLCHCFFDVTRPWSHPFRNFLSPILHKLQPRYLFRLKANLRPRTSKPVFSAFHTDFTQGELNQKTAIFYINSSNGVTRFEDPQYDDVPSVANRLLTFDGNLRHCGSAATNLNARIILNINYIPSDASP